METVEVYLKNTKSAVHALINSINDYLVQVLKVQTPVFVSSSVDPQVYEVEYNKWERENEEEIRIKLEAQEKYLGEQFAQAVLCGSLLQIASMGISQYSKNSIVPDECKHIPKIEGAVKYCVGRKINDMPIGLIVYAGRNQYNHYDENSLRNPSSKVFEQLAFVPRSRFVKEEYMDPSFDLTNINLINYAANIIHLLGWRSYENYEKDMQEMLGRSGT